MAEEVHSFTVLHGREDSFGGHYAVWFNVNRHAKRLIEHLTAEEPGILGKDFRDLAILLRRHREQRRKPRLTPEQDRAMLRTASRHLLLYLAHHAPRELAELLESAAEVHA